MPSGPPQIFAFSGIIYPEPGQPSSDLLIEHAISLAPARGRKRVCYLPTAVGDLPAAVEARTAAFVGRPDVEFSVLTLFTQPSVPDIRAHLLAQDVLLVEGGSVVNLMAVWRAHGLAPVMRECWESGVVLAGWSAGSLCWHRGGPTDSFGDSLAAFTDGLGLLPYSNGVHDALGDQPRRRVYREYVAGGALPAGYATEDGVGLHYIGTELHEAVAMVDGGRAWWVEPSPGGGYRDEPIGTRRL
ncbi:MAG TPA: peptidase E [Streptosporangiaceae bacterium]|nr:peptidase E [Streptosporangiaceae bacterium]